MESGLFIDDFPIKTSIYEGFSMAMLNNQRVYENSPTQDLGKLQFSGPRTSASSRGSSVIHATALSAIMTDRRLTWASTANVE